MIKEALEYLLSLGKVEQFEINGRQYVDRELEPIMTAGVERFNVHTLMRSVKNRLFILRVLKKLL